MANRGYAIAEQDHTANKKWLMVAIAFITQNTATGLAFGSFGTLILSMEKEFSVSRQDSSLAISLLLLAISVGAPIVGAIIERVPIRLLMIVGILLGAAGFAMLSIVPSIEYVWLIYGLMIGPGAVLFGVLVSNTLVVRWAEEDRGKALGIVNMPVFVMIVPLIAGVVLENYGLRNLFLALAIAQIAILPLVLMVRDRPPGQDRSHERDHDPDLPSVKNQTSIVDMLRRPSIWVVSIAIGIIVGGGTMKVAHFVPLLIEQGRSFDEANFLFAISGGAGIIGSLGFGWLADRIGGARTLITNALIQAAVWGILLAPVGFALLFVDSVLVGACGAGIMGPLGVFLASLFGQDNFGRAFGITALLNTPILVGMTPLAGYLYDIGGSYFLPVVLAIGGFILSAIMLAALVIVRGTPIPAKQKAE